MSRHLIETVLRAHPSDMLALAIEGDSMAPQFLPGDQLLVDKRRQSISQPGAFCLWDGDGHVVKLLERVAGSDPPRVRVLSRNPIYGATERLVADVTILGRVVWFSRRV
ncbi:S24 family peptidase [Sphingomonas morindae]|uniref:Peptidase S24/S26A/S26B/S26C domain-containing protein n=1 Tax=Sphingomonas morindae TaxID=1541170 RepID=A0ABY4XD61_9SPHN|nr:S24 family peptidase [Sphingomonas morindae]USI74615.1 hypothetical protein LHA26_15680 [Sphingomonas morindae]